MQLLKGDGFDAMDAAAAAEAALLSSKWHYNYNSWLSQAWPTIAYTSSSIFLSFWNKFVMLRFPAASLYLTLTFGLTLILGTIVLFTCYRRRLQQSPLYPSNITRDEYIYKLAPIGFLFGMDVLLTTLAIMQGSIPFVEMIKAGVPSVLVLFECHRLNWRVALCMLALTCGHALLYATDVTFNTECLICSLAAMICAAAKLTLTERLASQRDPNGSRKLHPLLAIFYCMPICIVLSIVSCLVISEDIQSSLLNPLENSSFLFLSMIGGIAAFVINLSEVAILAQSSALVFTCLVGGLKMAVMIAVSHFCFDRRTITKHNALAYAICALSIVAFQWVRLSDAKRAAMMMNDDDGLDDAHGYHLADGLDSMDDEMSSNVAVTDGDEKKKNEHRSTTAIIKKNNEYGFYNGDEGEPLTAEVGFQRGALIRASFEDSSCNEETGGGGKQ